MNVYISVPCVCIIDNEPAILRSGKKEKLNIVMGDDRYDIIEGTNSEISFDKIIVKRIVIDAPGVDLTLDRHSCHDILKIHVCKGSCVWLKNFFDVFPEMILSSEGHIRQLHYDGRYIVENLTIKMNPDYANNSSVIGFQVVKKLDIKYQYNGLIQGYCEIGCEIKKPDVVCTGKCSKMSIKTIGTAEQSKILSSRGTDSYRILVNITMPNPHIVSICGSCSEILPCYKLSQCEHILCHKCIRTQHNENGSNMIPPYFNCPIYHCQKKVMELQYLDDSDAHSHTDEDS